MIIVVGFWGRLLVLKINVRPLPYSYVYGHTRLVP